MFHVIVSFPFSDCFERHTDLVEFELGQGVGRGTGWGVRDIQYETADEETAKMLVSDALALDDLIPGITAEYYCLVEA